FAGGRASSGCSYRMPIPGATGVLSSACCISSSNSLSASARATLRTSASPSPARPARSERRPAGKSETGSVFCGDTGHIGAEHVLLRDLGQMLLEPGGHGDFLFEYLLADIAGFRVSQALRGRNQDAIGGNLHMLEGIGGHGALDDLVIDEGTAHPLGEGHHPAE